MAYDFKIFDSSTIWHLTNFMIHDHKRSKINDAEQLRTAHWITKCRKNEMSWHNIRKYMVICLASVCASYVTADDIKVKQAMLKFPFLICLLGDKCRISFIKMILIAFIYFKCTI